METLKAGYFYHIHNRGINSENIFWSDKDFRRFLNRLFYYLYPCAEIYSYCLLKNHFHILLRIRSNKEQELLFKSLKAKFDSDSFHGINFQNFKVYRASSQMGHLLNSHTKYINTSKSRTGDLFEGRFKRIVIDSDLYLSQIICYIHRNPIHHRIVSKYEEYAYSSYKELMSESSFLLSRSRVMEIFGTKENYVMAHNEFKRLLGDEYWLE